MGKIDGIIRDPKTGVVIARRDRHPLADLLRAIPSGAGDVAFTMPPELQHVIAIHLFDNLNCSPPRNPLYEYVEETRGIQGGQNQGAWKPPAEATAAKGKAAAPKTLTLPDPSSWDADHIAGMKAVLRNEEIKRGMIAAADPVPEPQDPTVGGAQ